MKETVKVIGIVLIVVVVAIGAKFAQLGWRNYFGPKEQNVERNIFEETKSYNEGKIQQLAKYRHEWMTSADMESKFAIESTVRSMFADYDTTNMPEGPLKTWVIQIRGY